MTITFSTLIIALDVIHRASMTITANMLILLWMCYRASITITASLLVIAMDVIQRASITITDSMLILLSVLFKGLA